ncbi:MAG: TonB-dependent receptor [Treponema sp.]|jgi:outer membrane receptor for ferrienterochelin and colicins|nr:TonB-dependent receptor [Treponema sp.]
MLDLFFLFTFPVNGEEEESVYQLDEITVTGTRSEKRLKDSPVVTEIITAEEIEQSNADTVMDMLNDYGLVYTGNGMGDYVQMQGMGKSRVLYLINGRRLVGRISQRLKGETLPLGNVERIEIVRGPQSALYGSDGIGGVINIITKEPGDTLSLSTDVTNRFLLAYDDPETPEKAAPFQDFNPIQEQSLRAAVGFPLGITRNSVDIEAARGGFYYNEQKTSSILPEYYRGRLGLDTAFSPGSIPEVRLGGSFMLMRRDDQTTSRGSLTRFDYLRGDAYGEMDLPLFEYGGLTLRLYDNYYQRNKDNYSAINDRWSKGNNYENENITTLEALGSYDGLDNFIFTLGLEGTYNSMEKYNLSKPRVAVDKEALFLQAEHFREDTYAVLAGVRVERNSQFGFAAAPKLSGMYRFPLGFRLLAGIGVGYRAPDFSDLYLVKDDSETMYIQGNEDLLPEYSLGFNAGLEYAASGRFVQINFYYNELFDEMSRVYIETLGDRIIYATKNISRSMRTGVDTEGRITVLRHGFVSAGYSWLYAYDRTLGEELYLQPDHTVKMKVGLDHPPSGIATYLQGRFFSKMIDPGKPDNRPRFILDFYCSIAVGKHFKIHAAVDNITGELHYLGPLTRQTFSIGFKYSL